MEINLDWDSGFAPEDAQAVFDAMLSTADSRLVSLMSDTGLNIEKDAKQRVPVETSNLRGSIESETRTGRSSIVTEIGTNVKYAPFVEFGTRDMAAQPYLRPAMDSETRHLKRDIMEAVADAADREGNA